MGDDVFQKYNEEIVNNMRSPYKSLSEKDRRHYAAIEAKKLVMAASCTYLAYLGVMIKLFERESLNSIIQSAWSKKGFGAQEEAEYQN